MVHHVCIIHFTGFVAVRYSAFRRVLHNPYCKSRCLEWFVYYTMEHVLSFVIYLMPLAWFSDWVSHSRFSVITLHSYAPAVVAMQYGFWLMSIMMPMVSWLHGFFCYQVSMFKIQLGFWVTLQPGFELGTPQLKATTRVSVATTEWMSMLLTMKLGLWVTQQLVLYWLRYYNKGTFLSRRWLRVWISVCILTVCCRGIWWLQCWSLCTLCTQMLCVKSLKYLLGKVAL